MRQLRKIVGHPANAVSCGFYEVNFHISYIALSVAQFHAIREIQQDFVNLICKKCKQNCTLNPLGNPITSPVNRDTEPRSSVNSAQNTQIACLPTAPQHDSLNLRLAHFTTCYGVNGPCSWSMRQAR